MAEPQVTPYLVYDTRELPLSAGVRSVGGSARRLLFSFDDTELMLQMTSERHPGHIRFLGQLLEDGMPVPGASVALDGPTGHCVKSTDDEGQFRVTDVQCGAYRLEIRTPAHRLRLDALAIDVGGVL